MNIVAVADLHGRLPEVPECDVLIIAGDLCPDFPMYRDFIDADISRIRQSEWLASTWAEWEQKVPAKHILATPGNHDWIARMPENCRTRLLIDEECEIEGRRFYGTPWVPPVSVWNYMLLRHQRKERFNKIPYRLDVLISHCPPHKILDKNSLGEHCGCEELRQAIYRAKPDFNVFGHIHEGRREGFRQQLGKTVCFNASLWQVKNWQPIIFELK